MEVPVLCPECWAAVPVERWLADQKAVVCANCGCRARPRELVLASSLAQLDAVPSWARRSEAADGLMYSVRGRSRVGIGVFALGMGFGGVLATGAVAGLVYRASRGHVDVCFLTWVLLFLGICATSLWRGLVVVFGRVKVRIRDEAIEVFTGIGPLGRTRTIGRAELLSVRRETQRGGCFVALTTPKIEHRVGFGFPEERVNFLQAVICKFRPRPGPCVECHYDLRGTPPGAPCPECGSINAR